MTEVRRPFSATWVARHNGETHVPVASSRVTASITRWSAWPRMTVPKPRM
jgi:hypothetical protein